MWVKNTASHISASAQKMWANISVQTDTDFDFYYRELASVVAGKIVSSLI
jgi:hypothetical protein